MCKFLKDKCHSEVSGQDVQQTVTEEEKHAEIVEMSANPEEEAENVPPDVGKNTEEPHKQRVDANSDQQRVDGNEVKNLLSIYWCLVCCHRGFAKRLFLFLLQISDTDTDGFLTHHIHF